MCLGGEQSLALMTQRVHQQVAAHVNASSASFIQTMGHIKGSVEMISEFKPEWKPEYSDKKKSLWIQEATGHAV